MQLDSTSENGVYYRMSDYGSLSRRFVAIGIDFTVLALLWLIIAWIGPFSVGGQGLEPLFKYAWLPMAFVSPTYFWVCLLISCFYMTIIKASRLRTIGYRIASLKVVTLKGLRPSVFQMTWRFVLLFFGPIDLIVDLIWLGGDDNRQTIRDKIAATYVIRPKAIPIGAGQIVRRKYFLLGWSMIFQEVKRNRTENNVQ